MKNRVKQFDLPFRLTVFFAWTGAAALCSVGFLAYVRQESLHQLLTYIAGAVFWCSCVLEHLLFWMANAGCRNIARRLKKSGKRSAIPVGFVSFFKTPKGTAADVTLFLSAAAMLLMMWQRIHTGWILTAVLAAVYLTLNLHCLYNGRNYRFMITRNYFLKERGKNE